MKRVWLLQQDNDPKHTWKSTIDYIKGDKLKGFVIALTSADLKNLWVDLKKAEHARRPQNLTELKDFCKKEGTQTKLEFR